MDAVEQSLSQGKAPKENIQEITTAPSPSLGARKRIAAVMETIVKGDFSYASAKAELADIRGDARVPPYLSVEAGYLLLLLERMEGLSRQASRSQQLQKEVEDARKALELERKEKEDARKELEELRFKLKKLEEIHIESLKRRGEK